MKPKNTLRFVFALLAVAGASAGCDRSETQPDPIDSLRPDYAELIDLDGDGNPELVLGFPRDELLRLPAGDAVLEGIFSGTDTRITTGPFALNP